MRLADRQRSAAAHADERPLLAKAMLVEEAAPRRRPTARARHHFASRMAREGMRRQADRGLHIAHKAVELLAACRAAAVSDAVPAALLRTGEQVTDSNAAFFDPSHGFAGCIAGLHEVLRRQGMLTSTRCLDPHETLSPGQAEAIDRVYAAYPHLHDDACVLAHRDAWSATGGL